MVKNLPTNAGDTGDTDFIPGSGRSPGEGNGNPLQYSCLGNPVDRGAWQGAAHGATKSWTEHACTSKENIASFFRSMQGALTNPALLEWWVNVKLKYKSSLRVYVQLGVGGVGSILILIGNGKALKFCISRGLKQMAHSNRFSGWSLIKRWFTKGMGWGVDINKGWWTISCQQQWEVLSPPVLKEEVKGDIIRTCGEKL